MIIGMSYVEDAECEIHKEDDEYFYIDTSTSKKNKTNLASIASIIGMYWSLDSIKESVETTKNGYLAKKIIPIYDGVFYELFGYGNDKDSALKEVNLLFFNLISLNDQIEKNIERNYKNQMKKCHRFGILPKNKKLSTLDQDYYNDLDLMYFSDGNERLEDLAINAGVPSDGRANESIMGYIYENKIVFTRNGFIKGEFEKYKAAIDNFLHEIIKYYNIKNPEIYYCAKTCLDTMIKNGDWIDENIDEIDFDYFTPLESSKRVN